MEHNDTPKLRVYNKLAMSERDILIKKTSDRGYFNSKTNEYHNLYRQLQQLQMSGPLQKEQKIKPQVIRIRLPSISGKKPSQQQLKRMRDRLQELNRHLQPMSCARSPHLDKVKLRKLIDNRPSAKWDDQDRLQAFGLRRRGLLTQPNQD